MALVAETPQKSVPARQRLQADPSTDYHQVDNTYRLTTPENISFEYQLAGPFRRLFPYILDMFLISAIYAALVFLVMVVISLIGAVSAYLGLLGVAEMLFAIGNMVALTGLFLMFWFYGAYMETNYNGRTFGKMVAGLRVISTDGQAIDGVQATLRNLFRWIDLMPFITLASLFENNEIPQIFFFSTGIFGLIVMSLSPKFQRLGDLVSGTMVVNEEGQQNPHVQTFTDSRVSQLAELIPSSFYVSGSLSKTVAVYVERRDQLGVARAGEIASKLAGTLVERFGLPPDTDADLLICSLYYKIFVGDSNLDNDSGPDSKLVDRQQLNNTSLSKLSRYQLPSSEPQAAIVVDPIQISSPSTPVPPEVNPSTDSELE